MKKKLGLLFSIGFLICSGNALAGNSTSFDGAQATRYVDGEWIWNLRWDQADYSITCSADGRCKKYVILDVIPNPQGADYTASDYWKYNTDSSTVSARKYATIYGWYADGNPPVFKRNYNFYSWVIIKGGIFIGRTYRIWGSHDPLFDYWTGHSDIKMKFKYTEDGEYHTRYTDIIAELPPIG